MLLGRYVFLIRFSVICVVVLYVQVRQLAHQLLARGLVAFADLEGQYLAALPALGVPSQRLPALRRPTHVHI